MQAVIMKSSANLDVVAKIDRTALRLMRWARFGRCTIIVDENNNSNYCFRIQYLGSECIARGTGYLTTAARTYLNDLRPLSPKSLGVVGCCPPSSD